MASAGFVKKDIGDSVDMFDWDLNHLKKVELGYFRHFGIAMYLNGLMFAAAILGTIHAFFPWVFALTPARLVVKANKIIEENFNID